MKTYVDGYTEYLELHDNHTIWKIEVPFDWDEYGCVLTELIRDMENKYKDLEIYTLGRSGRHICVNDTPVNRRRYKYLVEYALKLEQKLINYFNNKEEM